MDLEFHYSLLSELWGPLQKACVSQLQLSNEHKILILSKFVALLQTENKN